MSQVKILFIVFFVSLMNGCTNSIKKTEGNLYSYDFVKKIDLKMTPDEMLGFMGVPSKIIKYPDMDGNIIEHWFYKTQIPGYTFSQIQFGINKKTGKVTYKSYEFVDEKILAKDLILKDFREDAFNKYIPPQTGHEIPSDAFYTNQRNTVRIHASRWDDDVESVTWFSDEDETRPVAPAQSKK